MLPEEKFTEEELFQLTNTPYLIGAAMVFAGGSGLGTIKELYANAKSFLEGAKKFPNNAIITTILPNMEDWRAVRKETKAFQEKAQKIFKEKGIGSPEAMQTYAEEETQKVLKLLEEKATKEELQEYKTWILSIAENVAKAAKEGGFLGFGGERISDGEEAFYAKIAKSLGADEKLV